MTSVLSELINRHPTFVPPTGELAKSKVAFVGEQPGKMEVCRSPRRCFVGPAGRELTNNMHRVGLLRDSCYFTNVIKDLDKKLYHYFTNKKNYTGPTKEGTKYYHALEEELRSFDGVIVAVGNVSLHALTGRYHVTKWRGSVLDSTLLPGRKVVPILHPATVLPPKNVYLNRLLIQFDLEKVKKISEGDYKPTTHTFVMRPTFVRCLEYLAKLEKAGLDGKIIYFDIEIHNEEVSCISFALDYSEGICIPFIDQNGDYFTMDQELEIWKGIARILEHRDITACGQNVSFDSHFLLRKYGIKIHGLHDTMIAQQIYLPDYPKGLDFITSVHTDMPYYKDEGKYFFKGHGGRWSQLWEYNIRDSLVCAEAFPKQMIEVEKQDNMPTYERQRTILEPITYMQERGILVDIEGMTAASREMEKKEHELEEELWQLCGYELNAKSPKQVANYFYRKKGIKPYIQRSGKNKGAESTNIDAMKRLSRRGFAEAKIILDIRNRRKLRSTYAPIGEDGWLSKVDRDKRIRCSYNPVGTRYSRLSSSSNIFDTGMNMQNWPHQLLQYLISDDGFFYWSYDLAQAENRIVAYVGRVTPMIDAFESGMDVHSLTGSLISGLPWQEVLSQDKADTPCPLGDGTKTWRFWGKKANHGLNYDQGYRAFAFQNEIPERDGYRIVEDGYHRSYPGVRQNFHNGVKKQLEKNRTLTNLMGRRTVFLDRWGDSLFKEAYSCIPQGTVGDIINERGLSQVYYDQENFYNFEVLTQVHDSVGGQARLPNGSEWTWTSIAEALLKIKKSLEIQLHIHSYDFTIPADLTVGFNMYKGHCFDIGWKDFPTDAPTLAKTLSKNLRRIAEERGREVPESVWRL
jgi:uracil-DNA glycosylase family 4